MSPKNASADPADETYKAPDPAPPDEEAETQELARAVATTHGESGAPKPPAPEDGYPEGEAAPGYHKGPPPRINCEKCGHAHQAAGRQQYTECERCGAKLPAKPE